MDTPAALSVDALESAIQQYRTQLTGVADTLTTLEQQRVELGKMSEQLTGAIAALEQVIRNVADEQAKTSSLQD